jgi:hypothetical protein
MEFYADAVKIRIKPAPRSCHSGQIQCCGGDTDGPLDGLARAVRSWLRFLLALPRPASLPPETQRQAVPVSAEPRSIAWRRGGASQHGWAMAKELRHLHSRVHLVYDRVAAARICGRASSASTSKAQVALAPVAPPRAGHAPAVTQSKFRKCGRERMSWVPWHVTMRVCAAVCVRKEFPRAGFSANGSSSARLGSREHANEG